MPRNEEVLGQPLIEAVFVFVFVFGAAAQSVQREWKECTHLHPSMGFMQLKHISTLLYVSRVEVGAINTEKKPL